MFVSPASRQSKRGSDETGQSLVEFALVFPLLMILFFGVIEFAVGFNAFMGLNRASQHAAHTAAIMGNQLGTDCLILSQVEEDVYAPNNPAKIQAVIIERTSLSGKRPFQHEVYDRVGSSQCALPDSTIIEVPYTPGLRTYLPYPEEERCMVLHGCEDMDPPRSTVDNIGVRVRYRHDWITPLSAIVKAIPGGVEGWTFTQRNIFRMEPVL